MQHQRADGVCVQKTAETPPKKKANHHRRSLTVSISILKNNRTAFSRRIRGVLCRPSSWCWPLNVVYLPGCSCRCSRQFTVEGAPGNTPLPVWQLTCADACPGPPERLREGEALSFKKKKKKLFISTNKKQFCMTPSPLAPQRSAQ